MNNKGDYLFPSLRTWTHPLSENTLNTTFRRMGYSGDEMTAHGFRASFSTLANESGLWNPDAIERALAYVETNEVRRAYARGSIGRGGSGWQTGGLDIWMAFLAREWLCRLGSVLLSAESGLSRRFAPMIAMQHQADIGSCEYNGRFCRQLNRTAMDGMLTPSLNPKAFSVS